MTENKLEKQRLEKRFVSYAWRSLERKAVRLQSSVGRSDIDYSQTYIVLEKDFGNKWFSYARYHAMLGRIGVGHIKLY